MGVTVRLPESARAPLQLPDALQLDACEDVQVKVVEVPAVSVDWPAVNVAVGCA
jgi:hypothetical protein